MLYYIWNIKVNKIFFNYLNIYLRFFLYSWVVFSGIYVETPLLIQKLPEGWRIPSLLMGVSQLYELLNFNI